MNLHPKGNIVVAERCDQVVNGRRRTVDPDSPGMGLIVATVVSQAPAFDTFEHRRLFEIDPDRTRYGPAFFEVAGVSFIALAWFPDTGTCRQTRK